MEKLLLQMSGKAYWKAFKASLACYFGLRRTIKNMQIKDLPQVQSAKVKLMGDNFLTWFGDLTVDATVANTLFSIPLPKPMTGREIMTLGATPVQPRDVYTTVKTLKKGGLFIVTDSQGTNRVVFVFKNLGDTAWTVVSRELEAEPWFGDIDIYSLTQI